jgi:hypothetical protein
MLLLQSFFFVLLQKPFAKIQKSNVTQIFKDEQKDNNGIGMRFDGIACRFLQYVSKMSCLYGSSDRACRERQRITVFQGFIRVEWEKSNRRNFPVVDCRIVCFCFLAGNCLGRA